MTKSQNIDSELFIHLRAIYRTYLISGCVGRGVRLGSESSSGGGAGGGAGAGGGVWKSGNLEIWEFGDLEAWKSRNLGSKNSKK